MTSRSRLLLVLVWVAGAVVATSIGLLAVRQVASSVGDPAVPVLSDGGTGAAAPSRSAVASPTPASLAPSPTAGRPSPATPVRSASFRTAGGTIGVQCSGATPSLLYATPADGYALDERSVEGSELEVRFEAGERRVKAQLSCATGSPRLVEQEVDAD